MKGTGIITLTTDFGLSDPYVGIMKGVILSINPEARVIDISHQIKAGSITHGAGLLREAHHFFPKGAVHVGVVDPGVGGDRRPILINTGNHFFVGPDNGLLWPIIDAYKNAKIIHLTESDYFLPFISKTFHGRDIFAPVAAHLSRGVDPLKMGSAICDPAPLQFPVPQLKGGGLCGQIIRVDYFGNIITNIHWKDLSRFLGAGRPIVEVNDLVIENVCETYTEAKPGELLALIGSSDCLEIAVNLGRASDRLGMDSADIIGMEVKIRKVTKTSQKRLSES